MSHASPMQQKAAALIAAQTFGKETAQEALRLKNKAWGTNKINAKYLTHDACRAMAHKAFAQVYSPT